MTHPLYPVLPVLFIDDEPFILDAYRMAMRMNRINNMVFCSDSRIASGVLREQEYSLVVLDLTMPYVSGMEILELIKNDYTGTPVIIVTGVKEITTAVDCMKKGAIDFLVKPVDEEKLIAAIQTANELAELKKENEALRAQMLHGELHNPEVFKPIITASPSMKAIFSYVEAISCTMHPILITGESGTGKELIAKAIHAVSGRKGPFVPVNIGGLDDNAFSDTLFGHCKGAFTGADRERTGLIEKAAGGTLFLDEIGTLGNRAQIKLLRLLQEKQYYTLGSDTLKTADVAVIAATNENIVDLLNEKRFRNDLYYRLKSHRIHIPPLRERTADIPPLVHHFASEATIGSDRKPPEIPSEIFGILAGYPFPGNVRELQGMVHDITMQCTGSCLDPALFKQYISDEYHATGRQPDDKCAVHPKIYYTGDFPTLEYVKNYFIEKAMTLADGKQSLAAAMLGISQPSLSRWAKNPSDSIIN
ncbi:MAG: sigma-54-dependent Fis family transcriptional regulator [Candidatus Latescibacteria bacterium]|nr:sigma-54-dependent Fis family transcriptional regulator [Candidatus Latescibacterota bacterium]